MEIACPDGVRFILTPLPKVAPAENTPYQRWKSDLPARKASGWDDESSRYEVQKRSTGAPVKKTESAVDQWYRPIGYDPSTMNHADLQRLMDEDEVRWKASIPGTPLNKRERGALLQLAQHGVGVPVLQSTIKDCGCDTQDRLQARGFLEVRYRATDPDRFECYVLTEAGLAAHKAISSQ